MFGDKSTLTAHFNAENFIDDIDADKLTEIASQVSDLITSYTGITANAVVLNNPPILRSIWANIVLYTIIPYQTDLPQEEKTRREKLYEKAFQQLDKISAGEITVKSSGGTILNASASQVTISGTKRITGWE